MKQFSSVDDVYTSWAWLRLQSLFRYFNLFGIVTAYKSFGPSKFWQFVKTSFMNDNLVSISSPWQKLLVFDFNITILVASIPLWEHFSKPLLMDLADCFIWSYPGHEMRREGRILCSKEWAHRRALVRDLAKVIDLQL